jgi:UDP-glucose 4-epimerase
VRSRRILVTGLSTLWGGRLAQALERDGDVEAIIGVSPDDPTCELERTEFVRVGLQHALLRRIVHAADIDTVIDTRLVVDSLHASARAAHEANVIGTMNILAACGGPDSPVRKVVFKSSAHYYGCEQDDPAFFTEAMRRPHAPRTRLEADIVEAEKSVEGFAKRNPDVTVTVLRFANALGPGLDTTHTRLFDLPAVPCILGFDPRYQFIHEDDLVAVLRFAVEHDLPGVYNAAGAPILPPWGASLAGAALRRLGVRIPPEVLNQLRYGRGLDNRALKGAGYAYGFTSREAVLRHAEAQRVRPLLEGSGGYRYEREVEEFLRWSPNVRRRGTV